MYEADGITPCGRVAMNKKRGGDKYIDRVPMAK